MSKELVNRAAAKAASKLLIQRGYEIIEENWRLDENDSVYIIARDEDETLVFCELIVGSPTDEGLPEERSGKEIRKRGEYAATRYLLSCSDSIVPTSLRFDEIAIQPLSSDRAFVRHMINCANR